MQCDELQRQIKVAPHTPLRHSNVKLRLYSGESLNSMGVFDTDCVVQGRKYHLSFEIVETSQSPLLSGSTCEQLGLIVTRATHLKHSIFVS